LLPSAIRAIETSPWAIGLRAILLVREGPRLGASRLYIGRQFGGYCDKSY
jgi:hypothetical protein